MTTTTTTYVIPAPGTPAGASTTAAGGAGKQEMPGLGRDPKRITCPFCGAQTVTRARSQIDVFTIVMVVLLVLFFCHCFGCRSCYRDAKRPSTFARIVMPGSERHPRAMIAATDYDKKRAHDKVVAQRYFLFE
jgi:LITAF-like zinc ribbon domain